jgi:hypothetical protein
MNVSLFLLLISFIGINSISDDECLNIARSCYNKKSLETCYMDDLPEGCHCCYNKFYLNGEAMENCVVASGQYYQNYYNLKPGDKISEYGMTYESILNTCSKYYNSGKNNSTTNSTTNSTRNSANKYSLSIIVLLLYIYILF